MRLESETLRTWDALNKANQGGIAIFGAQVVAFAGYRGCFVGTFLLLFLRASVATAVKCEEGYAESRSGSPCYSS